MARWKLTPRKNIAESVTPQEWARRFRCFQRDLGLTLGEFLAKYFVVWEKAKDYVTDYEASEDLIDQVPSNWRAWADARREELIFRDSVTHALRCNFPKLISRLFDQWITNGNPPKSTQASSSSAPVESSEHVSSNERCVPLKVSSPCVGGHDIEAAHSTRFLLRRGMANNEEAEERVTRENAKKRTLDNEERDRDIVANFKRRCITIPDDEEEDPDEDSGE